jgi:hypothetical protein
MRHVTPGLLLLSLLTGCSTLASHPPRHLDLSGQWQLNESLSDDPGAVMHQHISGGGGMRHHAGGMGGHGYHGGGGSWSGGSPRRGQNDEFLARPAKLSIQQGSSTLKLIADSVPTDFEYGEKVVASVQGGAAERTSGWQGQDFVVKYKVHDGPSASRSYELGDGGRQLIVHTEVTGGRGGTRKLRAVYEREPGVIG